MIWVALFRKSRRLTPVSIIKTESDAAESDRHDHQNDLLMLGYAFHSSTTSAEEN